MTDITKLAQSLKRRAASANEFGEGLFFIKADDVLALLEALDNTQAENELVRGQLFIAGRTLLNQQAKIAELALAAMDSEPVGFTDERNLHHIAMGRETSLIWGKQNSEAGDIALYRHVQPVVLDRSIFENWWESQNGSPLDGWDSLRTIDGYCDDGIDGQFDAWNACRAAMLAAAPQEVK